MSNKIKDNIIIDNDKLNLLKYIRTLSSDICEVKNILEECVMNRLLKYPKSNRVVFIGNIDSDKTSILEYIKKINTCDNILDNYGISMSGEEIYENMRELQQIEKLYISTCKTEVISEFRYGLICDLSSPNGIVLYDASDYYRLDNIIFHKFFNNK